MTGPENHELIAVGYKITDDPSGGCVLHFGGKVLARAVVPGNCWAVARMHFRKSQLGGAELKEFMRGREK